MRWAYSDFRSSTDSWTAVSSIRTRYSGKPADKPSFALPSDTAKRPVSRSYNRRRETEAAMRCGLFVGALLASVAARAGAQAVPEPVPRPAVTDAEQERFLLKAKIDHPSRLPEVAPR
jgi:hypothetical protein